MKNDWVVTLIRSTPLFITPIVFAIWRRAFPAPEKSEFDAIGIQELRRRNIWIDWVSFILGALGGILGLAWQTKLDNHDPGGLILGICLMIWFPTFLILTLAMLKGIARLREYIRWSELRTGRSEKVTMVIAVPMYTFAVWSLFYLATRNDK